MLPLLLSDFLLPFYLDSGNSTNMGLYVVHSPHSILLQNSPNYNRYPISTLSKHVILNKCSKTCNCLCMWSTMSATKKLFPAKALSYFHSNQSMCIVHVVMAFLSVPPLQFPSSPRTPAQISLWYLVAIAWWLPCGTVGLETPQTLPLICGPVPYLIVTGTTSNYAVNFLGRPIMEGRGGWIAL